MSSSRLFHQKAVVGYAIDCDEAHALFSLYLRHDEGSAEASLSLRHSQRLDGLDDAPQTLTLNMRPEQMADCHITTASHHVPPLSRAVLNLLGSHVKSSADVVSIDLTLDTPGSVLVPVMALPIRPRHGGDGAFVAFSRLCQATRLRLCLAGAQVSPLQHARLGRFAQLVKEHKLRAYKLDLRRLGGGAGLQETTWDQVHPATLLGPPAYHESVSPSPSRSTAAIGSIRKRARSASISPRTLDRPPAKRLLSKTPPPPWSPTEVNTPSTQGSPYIKSNLHTTHFTKPPPSPADLVHSLSTTLQKLPPELLRTALYTAFGRLDPRVEIDLDTNQVLSSHAPHLQCIQPFFHTFMRPLVRAEMLSLLDERFDQTLAPKLEQLVDDKLPAVAASALDDNMARLLDNVCDEHAQIQVQLREEADDAITEIHQTRDEGVRDVEAAVQEGVDLLSDHCQAITDDIDRVQPTTASALQTPVARQSLTMHGRGLCACVCTCKHQCVTRRYSI